MINARTEKLREITLEETEQILTKLKIKNLQGRPCSSKVKEFDFRTTRSIEKINKVWINRII